VIIVTKDVDEVLRQARAGDLAGYQGEWQAEDQPAFEDREPEALISRSLRVSAATYAEIRAIAAARRMSPSALMRQWIEDGVAAAQDEHNGPPDPASLVDRVQTDVARLARALRKAA
jgi:hypothetical protein